MSTLTCSRICIFTLSVCLLLKEENIKDTPTPKAVNYFNMFIHDTSPYDKLKVLKHGVEEVKFQVQCISSKKKSNRKIYISVEGPELIDYDASQDVVLPGKEGQEPQL